MKILNLQQIKIYLYKIKIYKLLNIQIQLAGRKNNINTLSPYMNKVIPIYKKAHEQLEKAIQSKNKPEIVLSFNLLCNALEITAEIFRKLEDYKSEKSLIDYFFNVIVKVDTDKTCKNLWNSIMIEKRSRHILLSMVQQLDSGHSLEELQEQMQQLREDLHHTNYKMKVKSYQHISNLTLYYYLNENKEMFFANLEHSLNLLDNDALLILNVEKEKYQKYTKNNIIENYLQEVESFTKEKINKYYKH